MATKREAAERDLYQRMRRICSKCDREYGDHENFDGRCPTICDAGVYVKADTFFHFEPAEWHAQGGSQP